jgi:hypothetical protein
MDFGSKAIREMDKGPRDANPLMVRISRLDEVNCGSYLNEYFDHHAMNGK